LQKQGLATGVDVMLDPMGRCWLHIPGAKNRGETETRRAWQGLNRKEICRSKYDTHKIKRTNRVKGKNLILKLWAGLDGSPGLRTVQERLATIQQNISEKTNVFKIECFGSSGQLPTERMKQKVCRFLSEIRSEKSLLSCSQ
jgi:hypothetical protein